MQALDIEWRHIVVGNATCKRCSETGSMLRQLVSDLNRECESRQVRGRLRETQLGSERIAESNQVLIDGHLLEETCPTIKVDNSACDSCGELTGQAEHCRTIELHGMSFEVPPAYLIRSVICRLGDCC